jgi:hypothetical protein
MPRRDPAESTGAIWWILSTSGEGLKHGGSRFVPPSVASPFGHGVAVLKARSMGRGIGGLGSNCRAPSRYFSDVTRGQKMCPAQVCRGDCGWGGEPANRCWGAMGLHRPRRRYAAGDGGQINKLWERRAAAAAPNRSGFPMPAFLAIPCASIAAAYRKKSVQRNLQQVSRYFHDYLQAHHCAVGYVCATASGRRGRSARESECSPNRGALIHGVAIIRC